MTAIRSAAPPVRDVRLQERGGQDLRRGTALVDLVVHLGIGIL